MFKLKQHSTNDFNSEFIGSIDLFVGSLGFEERSIFQAERLCKVIKDNIILVFDNYKDDKFRKLNQDFYESKHFNFLFSKAEDFQNESLIKINEKIDKLSLSKELINIYIDYSSMTKNWYSHILYGIFNNVNKEKINIFLGYTHAEHIKAKESENYNRIVSPLFGYCNLSVPNLPTSIVIGLGNEANRVIGLKEYFDAIPYVFHSDESYNLDYYQDANNLLEKHLPNIPYRNIFTFPVNDMVYTYYLLENLCLDLMRNHRVIMAPCGPKPFAILSLLLALKYSNLIEVWRITPGNKIDKINRKPTGLVTVLELNFNKQEIK